MFPSIQLQSRLSDRLPPNKRLKLAGGDRFKGSGVLCPWRGTDCRPLPLRRRAGRPQLKRDPLGSTLMDSSVQQQWQSPQQRWRLTAFAATGAALVPVAVLVFRPSILLAGTARRTLGLSRNVRRLSWGPSLLRRSGSTGAAGGNVERRGHHPPLGGRGAALQCASRKCRPGSSGSGAIPERTPTSD